jgi:hypothetical protein
MMTADRGTVIRRNFTAGKFPAEFDRIAEREIFPWIAN